MKRDEGRIRAWRDPASPAGARGRPSHRVMIIAHRGASAVAPESTRAAIREAVKTGAGMVELDVQMTREGRLIVMHDARLDRTSDGRGPVSQARYRDLAGLDAGSWFAPRFAGERILLASQAARLLPRRVGLNLELKRTPRRRALLVRVARLARRDRLHERLLISSFDPLLLAPLRRHHLRLALICSRRPGRSLGQAIALRCWAWHPLHSLVTRSRVARAHAAGLRVHAWVVDRPARARQLIRLGVDGLFTNRPATLRSLA